MLAILHSFPKDTAAGPSGLRIQHLLDAATIPLPTSICSALRDVVNLMASGNVPSQVSTYLAGGSLTALNKDLGLAQKQVAQVLEQGQVVTEKDKQNVLEGCHCEVA
ncbi:hypothetical protein EMCRGX_G003096 [Ephydatia muelleri]